MTPHPRRTAPIQLTRALKWAAAGARQLNRRLKERIARQEERNRDAWQQTLNRQNEPDPEDKDVGEHGLEQQGQAESEKTADTLIEVAVEAWGLASSVEAWAGRLGERREQRALGRVRWLRFRLSELLEREGIVLQDLTGQVWDEGDAVEVVNPVEPIEGQKARISTMLEPIVVQRGRLARRGKVSITIEEGSTP